MHLPWLLYVYQSAFCQGNEKSGTWTSKGLYSGGRVRGFSLCFVMYNIRKKQRHHWAHTSCRKKSQLHSRNIAGWKMGPDFEHVFHCYISWLEGSHTSYTNQLLKFLRWPMAFLIWKCVVAVSSKEGTVHRKLGGYFSFTSFRFHWNLRVFPVKMWEVGPPTLCGMC